MTAKMAVNFPIVYPNKLFLVHLIHADRSLSSFTTIITMIARFKNLEQISLSNFWCNMNTDLTPEGCAISIGC